MNKDRFLLEQAYISIYEAFNPNPEQQQAIDRLDQHGKDLLFQMIDFLSKGARKASFYYKSETTGREAVYRVNLGVDYGNIKSQSQDLINKHVANLPAGHQDIDTAAGINQETNKFFYRINFPSGISVGMKAPKQEKLKKHLIANPEEKQQYIDQHLSEVGIYIMGTVDKSEEVVPATKRRTVSAAQQLQRDLGTRQSKINSYFLRPKNISGVAINKGTIMLQDTQLGEPVFFQEKEIQPEDQEQAGI
jgi:hypothetical protein